MIEDAKGNLLEADAEALVNTVNCVGFMGKGIALQFKQAFPENFKVYERVRAGRGPAGTDADSPDGLDAEPEVRDQLPNQAALAGKSRYEDIASGLKAAGRGCAAAAHHEHRGASAWMRQRRSELGASAPMIEEAFAAIPSVRVLLYGPAGAPAMADRVIRTERPKLTTAADALHQAHRAVRALGYPLTLLEAHKLPYFLQVDGEPLKLNYEQGIYGPYAPNLNKVLEVLEGHFITGYDGSLKPESEMRLLEGAVEEADRFAAAHDVDTGRISRVADLIAGFESPYGMELLSSLHWVASRGEAPVRDVESAIIRVHAWNDRKRRILKPEHMRKAWDRLQELGWLG